MVVPGTVSQPLPALGLPPEALRSLRSAFSREVSVRLPRLLAVVRDADRAAPADAEATAAEVSASAAPGTALALAHSDATMLAEGCSLLGDAAGARALARLAEVLDSDTDGEAARTARLAAAETAALLLGRWARRSGE